ncbi:MAG: TadE/TadG family type IV pilus assembly protein [Actinomycetota bacterium]
MRRWADHGNAAVETVLLVPVLMVVLAMMIAGGRILEAKSAVETVAREAARAGSQASDPEEALSIVRQRGERLASELELDPARLRVVADVGAFRRGEPFVVTATYTPRLDDLPALGLLPSSFQVEAKHVELAERFKSR